MLRHSHSANKTASAASAKVSFRVSAYDWLWPCWLQKLREKKVGRAKAALSSLAAVLPLSSSWANLLLQPIVYYSYFLCMTRALGSSGRGPAGPYEAAFSALNDSITDSLPTLLCSSLLASPRVRRPAQRFSLPSFDRSAGLGIWIWICPSWRRSRCSLPRPSPA